MAFRKRQPLNPGQTLFARKTFKINGRTFARNAPFPWRSTGINTRKLQQLYDGRWIGHEQQPQHKKKKKAPKYPPVVKASTVAKKAELPEIESSSE